MCPFRVVDEINQVRSGRATAVRCRSLHVASTSCQLSLGLKLWGSGLLDLMLIWA